MSDIGSRTLDDLRRDLDCVTSAANACAEEACKAADNTLTVGNVGARELFLRQEQRALTAYEAWKKAAENLRHRLMAQ